MEDYYGNGYASPEDRERRRQGWANYKAGNKINLADMVGGFIPAYNETCFRTMDGEDVAEWLTAQGYEVVSCRDTGRNGLAVTKDGYQVSTNGYVSRVYPPEVESGLKNGFITDDEAGAIMAEDDLESQNGEPCTEKEFWGF